MSICESADGSARGGIASVLTGCIMARASVECAWLCMPGMRAEDRRVTWVRERSAVARPIEQTDRTVMSKKWPMTPTIV